MSTTGFLDSFNDLYNKIIFSVKRMVSIWYQWRKHTDTMYRPK